MTQGGVYVEHQCKCPQVEEGVWRVQARIGEGKEG